MSGLMHQREKILLEQGIYKNEIEFNSYKHFFSDIKNQKVKKDHLNITENLINEAMHTKELLNWLNFIKNEN